MRLFLQVLFVTNLLLAAFDFAIGEYGWSIYQCVCAALILSSPSLSTPIDKKGKDPHG